MKNLVVVVGQPLFGALAYFGEIAEDMHVEHAATEAAVEAFDEAVLHRTTGLDEVQDDALALGPTSPRFQ